MTDRSHAPYGRRVADEVVRQISAAYPQVAADVHPYDKGVWFTRVQFTPTNKDAVPIWLAVNADDRFVLTAGDTFRWELPFVPEDDQADQIVEEIRQLADNGVMAVRANRLLGPFSASVVGSPGVDAYLDEARAGRFAKVLEERSAWTEPPASLAP
jgi:hypothetical protein